MLTTLLTDSPLTTKNLFVNLLNFEVEFESDWFISMTGQDGARVGAMLRTSEFIPDSHQQSAQGVVITIIVENVDDIFQRATSLGLDIVEEPRDLPYGQRRLLIKDASGVLIDVSSPTAPLDESYRT